MERELKPKSAVNDANILVQQKDDLILQLLVRGLTVLYTYWLRPMEIGKMK